MEPIGKIATFFVAILSAGFGAGCYYQTNKADLEKLRMEQECNIRTQKLEEQLNQAKLEKYRKAVDNLTDVVNQIQQANHGH